MSTDHLIAHVNEAIAKALRGESYIDPSVLEIKGFSTATQRHLVSNLAHLPKENPCYLECGAFFGATACAAMSNNPDLTSFIVEDYSQPFSEEGVKESLERSIDRYRPTTKEVHLINADCFEMYLDQISQPVDLFFYDAVHEESAQRKAWSHFASKLSATAIIMIDDFSWQPVLDGTRKGIEDVREIIRVEHEWILSDGVPDGMLYHNGIFIAVISRIPTPQPTSPD